MYVPGTELGNWGECQAFCIWPAGVLSFDLLAGILLAKPSLADARETRLGSTAAIVEDPAAAHLADTLLLSASLTTTTHCFQRPRRAPATSGFIFATSTRTHTSIGRLRSIYSGVMAANGNSNGKVAVDLEKMIHEGMHLRAPVPGYLE